MPIKKIHVHIENARKKASIFHITQELWDAACLRHRTLARNLSVTIGWDGDMLETALKTAGMVIGVPPRRDDLRKRAPCLRWLHATSAGVDGLMPLDWLPRGVVFTNNRGAHGGKAEQYMRMALTMLNTRMPELIANQHRHHWQQLFSPDIAGKTTLIVGLGDLGEGAARAARQLGMKVIGVRRSARKSRFADSVHSYARLDALLPKADFLVLAVPLTAQTRNLLDRRRLDLLKPTAGVINIARAPVADYDALCDKLRRGELAGAVLDVVEPEPLPSGSPLWDTPNLVITPHISCDDGERYIDISLDLWFEDLARLLDGKPLKRRVNPKLGY
ncbi:MAG: D-2-hydroxyacid dehydrogenase [Burkholderiales bacterium]|nr:D-2-hydroxyacid dehydrogenase [Burkholderiales bacterium]